MALERVKKILLGVILLILLPSIAQGTSVKKIPRLVSLTNTKILLGPDGFSFCGGWVEIWAQVESTWSTSASIFVKASPPNGVNWKLWNAHVIVEHQDQKDTPIRFHGAVKLDIEDDDTNVLRLELSVGSLNLDKGLKVALRPFEGCGVKQEIRGIVLTRSDHEFGIE